MYFILLLVMTFLARFSKASDQYLNNLQPGCFPVPSLFENFSTAPEYWPHETPLLQTLAKSANISHLVKRVSGSWNGWQNVHNIFAFGDSYTSTNFTLYGPQPNPSNPLGNPKYPGATSAAGPNYIDFLTTTYNQSYIQTYNLGYGGATIDDAVVQSGFGDTIQSFQDQVYNEFLPVYANNSQVPWNASNSLFIVFFGINDVTNSYAEGNDTINYDLIEAYQWLVNILYDAGARNFLFLNVPPVDRSPGTLETSSSSQAAEAAYIATFNFRLGALVYNLGTRNPDTTLFLFDTNWLFTRVLDDPQQFVETAGYLNTTSYCPAYAHGTTTLTYFDPTCGVPINAYFWLNTLHPTYPMHNFLGSQITQFITSEDII
ncbi:hypothetical protein JMJ35_000629 [Cladonia borealis]|uniref:Carbohydrate esterase family 16 protein n=1 Tax=Cladonia borealis TaxID=184061 RepID=A0AA39RBB4_9LECA|nr:hypothetical protein JMJ35_000629 [Cladonia borealis]